MSKDLPPSRTAEQFVVRFPDGMRDKIADAAKSNNRSMNAEIIARLQESFQQPLISSDLQEFMINALKNYAEHIKQTKGDKK